MTPTKVASKKVTPMDIVQSAVKYSVPVVYLAAWYFLPAIIFGAENVDSKTLILGALPILFIGTITRMASWSIGGGYGIKGDNSGARLNASIDRRGSFELAGPDVDVATIQYLIDQIKENRPIVKK